VRAGSISFTSRRLPGQGLEWSQLSDVDTIVSDRSRVLRVLRFLLQAALERATIGNGSVKMSATYWPRKEAHGIPKMAFSVSDTGRHLDLAWVNGCFQSYFRTEGEGDEGRTDLSLSGSGQDGLELGLYVSYHVVQALGGTLECTPHTLDTGTTFTFDLPAQSLGS
jgi:signal transduction histidine kinase